jgi:hypothetical protein
MGNDIVRKRVEHGVVWITVRIRGYLYDVAAPAPDEWTLHMPGGIQHGLDALLDEHRAAEAKEVVTRWTGDNTTELALLFREAKEQRADGAEHGRRRPKRESKEDDGLAEEARVAFARDSGVRFKLTGGMVDAAGENEPAASSSRRR